MPGAGLEPAPPCGDVILSHARLPIPPPWQLLAYGRNNYKLLARRGAGGIRTHV